MELFVPNDLKTTGVQPGVKVLYFVCAEIAFCFLVFFFEKRRIKTYFIKNYFIVIKKAGHVTKSWVVNL